MTDAPTASGSDTPQQILEAAAAVIVREGIGGASLRMVAKEADVSLGLLSYHFDDKQTLLREAFRLATDMLLQRSLEASGAAALVDDPEARVEAYIRSAFHEDFLRPDYLHLRIHLWATSRTAPDVAAVERDLHLRYARHLADTIGSARPDLSKTEIDERAADVIVVENGLWLNWARYRNRRDLERGLRLCRSIALAP
jgi:AcrR family transcriptional regulator